MLDTILLVNQWTILFYFLILNTFYAALLVAAGRYQRWKKRVGWHQDLQRLLGSRIAPTLSVLAPAYNEEATVSQSVRALLTLQYPNLEVVVINDGSSDETLELLTRDFSLEPASVIHARRLDSAAVRAIYRSRTFPELLVVDKENGGKADSLNSGLDVAAGELVCAIDADTLIEPDALLKMVQPFLLRDDVIATGGTLRVVNGSEVRDGRVVTARVPANPLAGCQTVEYLRAFLFGRMGWNLMGGNLIISGAFGLFRREAVVEAGGYMHDSVGEDMELVVRMRREAMDRGLPHQVISIPDPVAWTEVPESLRTLGRQRDRWHRGLSDVMWRFRGMVFRPRYGTVGTVVVPFFLLVELLGPVIEAVGLIGLGLALLLGAVNWQFALLFFLVAYGYGLLLNMFTLLLADLGERRYPRLADRSRLVLWMFVESLIYRPVTVIWRLKGIWGYFRGKKEWGTMTRRGFDVSE